MTDRVTAASRYEALEPIRQPFVEQAYKSAALTIPALFPNSCDASQSDRTRDALPTPNQDIGSRGVNNLAAKMMLSLFPPNTTLFRYVLSPLAQGSVETKQLDKLQEMLAARERVVTEDIEAAKYRPKIAEAYKQILVAGNTAINLVNRQMRVFRLNRYVVKRDPMGEMIELVVKETLDRNNLPLEVQEIVNTKYDPTVAEKNEDTESEDTNNVDLFTHVKLIAPNRYREYQEVLGEIVPGTESEYPKDLPRWIVPAPNRLDGEDYGRGYVEEFRGALNIYDALQKALSEDAAIAAMCIFMINPESAYLKNDLEKVPNGGFVIGRLEDVGVLRVDKAGDLAIAERAASKLETSLGFAFLLNSSLQRDAERVTAEEIREIARELEDTQGGMFSVLDQELTLPVVRVHEAELERTGQLKPIPKQDIRIAILTGYDALGRNHDLQRLNAALENATILKQLDEQTGAYINTATALKRIFINHGVSLEDLIKSEEEVSAQMQQQQALASGQSLAEKLGPKAMELVSQMGNQPTAAPAQ